MLSADIRFVVSFLLFYTYFILFLAGTFSCHFFCAVAHRRSGLTPKNTHPYPTHPTLTVSPPLYTPIKNYTITPHY